MKMLVLLLIVLWSSMTMVIAQNVGVNADLKLVLSAPMGSVPELMYYKFDAAGNQQNYASAPVGNNPATLNGLTIGNTGEFGKALIGNGLASGSNRLNTGWATTLPSTGWTISFWINNFPSTSSTTYYFFGDGSASSFRIFTGGVAPIGGLILRGTGLTDVKIYSIPSSPIVIHLVYTGSVVKVYKNGVYDSQVAQTAKTFSGSGPFLVGGYGTSSYGINAGTLMDEFRLYSRALTQDEISLTWNQPLPVASTSISITFDSDGGSAVAPLTGNPGSPVVAPANPTKPGYTFAGWTPALPETFPGSNLSVVALWQSSCVSPTIVSQSTSAQTQCLSGSFIAITVTATGDGLTYQWYKNTTAAASGGTSLGSANGAQTNSYIPQATIAGTLYYYCIVTGTCGTATSTVSGAHTTNQLTAITSQSTAAQTKCLNIAFTPITVTAAGASLNYQWYSNTSATNSGGTSLGSANGAQTNSYTPQSTAAGTVYYYCVVTGSCGAATSAVSGAHTTNQLTAITSQSTAAQTVCINGSFSPITVTATGPGLIYQWYKNTVASTSGGTSLGTGNGANTNSYTPVANTAGTLYYYCVVTGTCGTETSAISGAFLVNPATIISNQSTATQTKCLNAAFTAITVTATGAGTLSYQWYSNTTASVTGGSSLGSANGAQTNSYTPQSTATGTLYYYCMVNGTCGQATSEISEAFIVNAVTSIDNQSTATQTKCIGGTFTAINLSATGGSLTYQWYRNTTASTTGGTSLFAGNGAQTASYTPQTAIAGTFYYYCIVTGTCGAATSTISGAFVVNPVTAITSQSTAAQSKCLNVAFTPISVTVAGGGLTYQWYSNTTASTTGGTSLGSANGADTNTYTPQSTSTGTLYYYCIIQGSCGPDVTSLISGAFVVNPAPVISSQSTATQTKCIDGTFTPITVTVAGTQTYQWYSNTTASTTGGTSLGTSNGANTFSFTPQATVAGTLYYYCIISGSCGSVTSAVSGAFITHPVNAITSQSTVTQTACINTSFTPVTVTAIGGNLTYQWYSNTSASASGGSSLGANNGANTNSYTPQSAVAGTLYYYCIVGGSCGSSATSTLSGAFITNPVAAITSQSTAAQSVCISGSYTAITVTATGAGLTYQWYKNTSASTSGGSSLGTNNGANTNSYTPRSNVAGTLYYYCIVTGSCGTATSEVSGAFITNAATAISVQTTLTQTKCVNVAFSPITVTATGPGLSYQWYSNTTASTTGGSSLAAANGAQTNSYTPQSNVAGTTYYYCIITGTCATATSSVSGAFTVNPLPSASGAITTGTATVCQGQATVEYGVAAITNATSYTWAYSGTGATITGTTNSVTITFAANATAGNLTVRGTNGCGNGTISANYAITVNAATVISGQSTGTQSKCTGEAFTAITITATGSGSLSYQWYSNTSAENSGGTSLVAANGAQTNSYTPQTATAGTLYYYCIVTGTCGTATSAVSGAFIVGIGTVIGSQSTAAQTRCFNSTFAPITVTATGAGTLTYQWYSNTSASLSGATSLGAANDARTSSYTPQATAVGTLYYYCIVQGGCGSAVTSEFSGAFIVSSLPSVPTSLTATPSTVCSGSSSLLNATSAGNTIEWYTASSGGTYLGASASAADFTVYPGSTAIYYAGSISSGSSSEIRTFDYTGLAQAFTVPAGVTSITVDASGAAGSANGGRVVTTLTVTPGITLNIYVGGKGAAGSAAAGGWNGGGNAGTGTSHYTQYSGGGASDIRIGGTALGDRVLVAGGGGGIGGWMGGPGGAGGGATGANGTAGQGGGGGGGTSGAGGAGGAQNGCSGTGGTGSSGTGGAGGACAYGGGGGGGGYYGGGGGGGDNDGVGYWDGGGGGGGSSYANPSSTSGTVHTQGYKTLDGQIIITWSATGSACPSATRASVTVTVTDPPTGGSVAATNSTIVYGSPTGTMTLSGNTGTVQKWQKSLDKGSWSDISNITSTCSEIPTSPGSWRYRAVVKVSCEDGYSTPCTVVVTKKELTIGGSFAVSNRPFDGTATATIATNSLTLPTIVGSDVVTLTGTTVVFDNKGAGTSKTISITGSTLDGTDAAKYTLSLTGAPTTTADITAITPTLGTFSAISKTYGDPAFVLVNPSSNSSGSFSYTSGNTAVATISGNTVTIVGAGTSTITANQAASGPLEGYGSNSTSATLTVAKANQVVTLTIPTSAPLKELVGTLAITATSSAGLSVTITKSGTATATLGGSPGSYTLSDVSSTGTLTFTATPAGDGNYNAATAIEKSFDVQKNNQTITFSGTFPLIYTYSPTLTIDLSAAATAAISPVTYVVVSGPATLSSNTLTITGAGTVVIRASQAGDGNTNAAPDVNKDITINKATPDITFAAINKVYTDAPFVLGASSLSTGAFTYAGSPSGVATVAKVSAVSTATLVGVGATTLTVTQAADDNYNTTTKDATLTVSKGEQTITFAAPADKIAGDANFNLSATSTSNLAVSFASGTTPVASLSGTNDATVTIGTAGTSAITASQAGNTYYNAAIPVERTLTVLACTNPTNGGTIATAQDNCTNFNPAAMTSSTLPTGHPAGSTLEYQWQKSTTSSSAGFTDITDATATTYDPSTISQTTWYKRLTRVSCRADWSGATSSNVIAMSVTPTAGGTVTGASTIDYTSSTGTMALSGNGGSVQKWQSSTDGVSWTDIDNTEITCTATPTSVGTWKYRAQVKSANCSEVKYSEALSITVTKKPLTITDLSIATKTYNGNTSATLAGTPALVGVKTGETVTLVGTAAAATFASRNVASGIAVTVTGYTISGTHAGNYTLTQPAGLTGTISAVQLTPHITANNKPYDGLTTATLSAQWVTGMITGEAVTLVVGSAIFDTKDIGTGNKTVTAASLTLGGADAGNYSLASGAIATVTTASITAVQLTPSITANNKPYDGNTTATLSAQSVSGMVGGETDVTLVVGASNFDNKDKGTSKTVTATTLSLGGADAGNYVLASGATATALANITAVQLTPHITASNKQYDGNTTASLSAQSVTGMVNSETGVDLEVSDANFDTKNRGTDKIVTATGLSLSGTNAGNYVLASGASATSLANITVIQLTPHITANNKPYDGLTTATLSTQWVTGMITGETDVTLAVGYANFDNSTIGTGKVVTATSLSLGGAYSGNYTLASGATATTTATITVLQLTPHITASNKPYDGNKIASLSAKWVTGMITGETDVTLSFVAATFDSKDKGTGKTITATGLTLGGTNAGNYVLASGATATTTANITPIQLTPYVTANDKSYDGNTTAVLSAQWVTGMLSGETDVTLFVGESTFDTKDKGTEKTVTARSLTLGGADAVNYTLTSGATATDLADISAVQLTPHIAANDKAYDGNTTATLFTKWVSGYVSGDNVTLIVGAANFENKNISTNKTVTAVSLSLGGTDAGNYFLASGATATSSAAITVVQLTPHITANNKAYDGNTTATLSAGSVSGFVTGDVVNLLVGAASFNSKNIGTDKTVTASNLTLEGLDAGNYVLATDATSTDLADITAVVLTPHITSNDKPYDGNATAALSAQTVSGMVNSEAVSLLVGASNFDTKNKGTNKTVTASNLSLGGSKTGNYVLASVTATDLSDITAIQVTPHITTDSKIYDGNTTASLVSRSVTGIVTGETVTLLVEAANFNTKETGTNKTVTASGLTLGGADAGNYYLASAAIATATADITAKQLTAHITASDKPYDGSTNATFTAPRVTGMVVGETAVNLGVGAASFDTKNAGTDKTVTASSLTLTGADAGNYALPADATATSLASITPIQLTPLIFANSKIYDGSTTAVLSSQWVSGEVPGDAVSLVVGASVFDSKDIGTDKTVTASTLSLGGSSAGNYKLATGATATVLANISAAELIVTGATALDKVYDRNDMAQITGASLSGVVLPDEVNLENSTSGTFEQTGTGTNIEVATLPMTITGAGIGNYTLTQPTGLKANISPKSLVPGITAGSKCFDEATTATLLSQTLTGVISPDEVSLGVASANFEDPNAGTGKTVFAGGLTLNGLDAANYTLSDITATATADIYALPVPSISGTNAVCSGSVNSYSTQAGNNSYLWTVSSGGTITSGGTTSDHTVTVTWNTAVDQTVRVNYKNAEGCEGASAAVLNIAVLQGSVGGSVAGSATVCSSTNSTTLTLSGYAGVIVKWQKSTDNWTTATDVGNTTPSLIATNLTATTKYRAVVQSGTCSTANSAEATVTIDPVSVGGTIAGSATVCSGTNSTTLTLSGHTGNVVKWQKSTDNWTTPVDVENTTTTLTGTNLTASTKYRAVLQSGVCSTANSTEASITVNPSGQVKAVGSQLLCSGEATPAVSFETLNTEGMTTYTWTNSKSSIGLPSSGTGNIASFTAVNTGTAPVTATIAVTPYYSYDGVSCEGGSKIFTITVNPEALVNQPANLAFCNGSGSSVAFATANTGGTTTYAWSNSNSAIGLAASGTGNIPAFIAVNAGTATASAIITVTPTYASGGISCSGPSKSFTVSVNPTAQVSQPANLAYCSGSSSAAVNFETDNTGGTTTYNWTNSATGIGLAASGTGNLASFKTVNNGTSLVVATIRVTPVFTREGVSCSGAVKSFTIMVNPTPAAATVADRAICLNTSTSLGAAAVAGSTYSWSSAPAGFSSAAANPEVTPLATTKYTLTETISATGCATQSSVLVTVNPLPAAMPGIDRSICPGTATTLGGTATTGNFYVWSSVPAGYTSMLANSVVSPATTTKYVVTEVMAITGCTNSQSVLVTVKSSYQLTVSGTSTVCSGTKNVVYSTTPGMTSYQWTLPSGANIVSGAATSSISVDYSSSATSGNVKVSGTNECGTVQSQNYAVTVNPTPTMPSFIVQNHTLISNTDLGNQWYLNGAPVTTNGNARQFTAANGGTVALLISLKGCQSPLASSVTITPMQANDLELDTYPNPNNGQFELRIETGIQAYFTIDIFNDQSQLLYRKQKVFVDKLLVEPVDLTGVASGTYIVRVYNAEASQVVKVIIRR